MPTATPRATPARAFRELCTVALAILGLTAARSSLADHYVVPTGSMEPTLVPGDRVVVDKRAYGLRVPYTLHRLTDGDEPARGDVVILDSPADGTRLIKRVVAVAGDLVEVRDGRVRIDGVPLATSAVEHFESKDVRLDLARGGGRDFGPVRVPDDQVLVLGDARGNSLDGRWFGFVREEELYARAMGVYWRSDDGFGWRAL